MDLSAIERVKSALEEIRKGKMVILVDDEDRENEGDLVMAAELCTPEAINFMAKYARGLICLSLTEDKVAELDIPMMVDSNRTQRSTAFTVSIEARTGVTTGISAADRCHTILTAVNSDAKPKDLISPGHVFPLKARPGGVLQRTGHTEGSVDLAQLAGYAPAGVICEIMKDDGTMARYPDLVQFAEQHDLLILTIADLIEYRLSQEKLVRQIKSAKIEMMNGKIWTAYIYEVHAGERRQFVALSYGHITSEPTLIRVHTGSVLGDVFRLKMSRRLNIENVVHEIEKQGSGVILFLPGQPDPLSDLSAYLGEPAQAHTMEQGEVLREYGLGAQVLADLGLRKIRLLTNQPRRIPSVEAYGLEVVEQVVISKFNPKDIVE